MVILVDYKAGFNSLNQLHFSVPKLCKTGEKMASISKKSKINDKSGMFQLKHKT